MLGCPNVLWWNWFCYLSLHCKVLVKERVMSELKEWRCNECGQEVLAQDQPDPFKWSDGHVCHFSEYEEPCFSELDPARHVDKEKLGEAIKNWPDA